MGRELVRVPPGFNHPTDQNGHPIPGAHHAVLYEIDMRHRTAYQIYENVSEGSPVSPVFSSVDDLVSWLAGQGVAREAAEAFLKQGFVPSFVIRASGDVVSGIEAGTPERE